MPNSVTVKLHWNTCLERWIAEDILGHNMYEFPNCGWFCQLFGNLDKESKHIVVVRVEEKAT